jgi:hypothetical protein
MAFRKAITQSNDECGGLLLLRVIGRVLLECGRVLSVKAESCGES